MKRLLLLALVALVLAPGTWLKTRPSEPDLRNLLQVELLDVARKEAGALAIKGVWHLHSGNAHFGGYSGLLALPGDALLAVSDRGRILRFPMPGHSGPVEFGVLGGIVQTDKRLVDAEAMTNDPVTGRIWIAYEGANAVERLTAGLVKEKRARPPAMRAWPGNRGPEAMARLADGRFIVIGEGSPDWFGSDYPAVLFDGDPVEGAEGVPFRFAGPEGYRAVDMAQIPDGRVLLLLRRVVPGLPPGFAVRLAIADPGEIGEGEVWSGETLGELADPLPTDNFEGLAVRSREDGALTVWIISDDNNGALQRTLVYRLRWDPSDTQKARENPARPSKIDDRPGWG